MRQPWSDSEAEKNFQDANVKNRQLGVPSKGDQYQSETSRDMQYDMKTDPDKKFKY